MLGLVEQCGRAYALSAEAGRRDYNQAWFEAIYLDADDEDCRPTVTRVRRTPLLASLQAHRTPQLAETISQEQQRRQGENLDGAEFVGVWNVAHVVELRGIEPLTYSMRTSRATNCATAPCSPAVASGRDDLISPSLAHRRPVGRPDRGAEVVQVELVVVHHDQGCPRRDRRRRGRL